VLAFCTITTGESSLSPPSLHRFGYARVSSVGQNLDSQVDALQKAECEKIFSDKTTGSRMDRPGWDQLMEYVRPADTLVVTELSRMTRSLLNLLETVKLLEQRQVNLSRKTTRDGADSLKDEMNASDFSLQRISVLFLLERRESDRTSACACPQWPGRGEILAAPDGPFR
jgi:DNA invertase Pin-like site-specific DNA recombinase